MDDHDEGAKPLTPAEEALLAQSGEALGKSLLNHTTRLLLRRVLDGTATAADLSVARSIAKDQGIQLRDGPGTPLGALKGALTDSLPFAGGGDQEQAH